MPYSLRGNKVVRSDTGQVVKDHGSDHAAAVKHLRALKANVEESSPVLGALLEGFASSERRDFRGRWTGSHHDAIRTAGLGEEHHRALDAVQRAQGMFPGTTHAGSDHAVAAIMGGAAGEHGISAYRPKRGEVSGARGRLEDLERAGILSSKTFGSSSTRRWAPKAAADLPKERFAADTKLADVRRAATSSRRLAARDALGIPREPRAPNEQRSDEMASGPLQRPGLGRRSSSGSDVIGGLTAQGWKRDASGRLVAPASEMHKNVAAKLTNLPVGGSHAIQDASATRTRSGFEVSGADGREKKVIKTPSGAAGHMVRLHRRGLGVQESAPLPDLLGVLLEGAGK